MKACKYEEFNLDKNKKIVLIVMGSLGSKTVNDKIFSEINRFKDKDYQVIFVTGNSYYEKIKTKKISDNVKVLPFVYDMPRLMKITDLMISRAGASTISEITALGIPTIFIPSPYVPNNHQYKNAIELVGKKAALIIEENNLTFDSLINLIDKTINDDDNLKLMKENLLKLGIKDSSTRIYDMLKEMISDDRKFY